jgi:hypothetical protein
VFERSIPAGWNDYLCNFVGEDVVPTDGIYAAFFEGTFRGDFEFEIIAPPPSAKVELLERAKAAIRHPPRYWSGFGPNTMRPQGEDERVFLQAYYVAPLELEMLLLAHRGGLDADRLRMVYHYLDMFDTSKAIAAVEWMKKHRGRFDWLGYWLCVSVSDGSGLGFYDNGVSDYVYNWTTYRRAAVVVCVVALPVGFLLWRRHRRNSTQKPE